MAAAAALMVLPGCAQDERPAAGSEPFDVSEWPAAETERAGAELFVEGGCMQCHVYRGAGSANLDAPDLTHEGDRGRGVAWQVRFLKNPGEVLSGAAMPTYSSLGDEKLRQLAEFLEASRS
jgi:cbb3-type cytochrome oxidase cytochrome c subunit